jgi:hypothetical protein
VQSIPTKQEGKDVFLATKRESYIEMVQTQCSIQPSMGLSNANGLINVTKKFILCRINEDGTQGTTIKKLVQSVIRYKTSNRQNIWLRVVPRERI